MRLCFNVMRKVKGHQDNNEAVISLSVCAHVRMYALQPFQIFLPCVSLCEVFFPDGSLFCLLVHIKRVFLHMYACVH